MVTYCVTKIMPTCSPVIGQFFDTMIVVIHIKIYVLESVTCRTGGLAGPARYKSAIARAPRSCSRFARALVYRRGPANAPVLQAMERARNCFEPP